MESDDTGGPGYRPDDPSAPLARLIGSGRTVPCLGGVERTAVELDQAASTQAHPAVADRVTDFLPGYSSVHRGAGYRSRRATHAYEEARRAVLAFAGRDPDGPDIAIFGRNTTESINHLAYRLRLDPADVVVTTVVEHHANLLPWGRVAERRYVECGSDGTFDVDDVTAALDAGPRRPALLAVTGASNVTGWLPPLTEIIAEAHARDVPVLVDAAQLAPHRPLPVDADFLALSGHKLYAPFGTGALIGPRRLFETGDPFLAGGGAVDLVGLDEVIWTSPPDREEAGSPNVVGAIALHAAVDALGALGWDAVVEHERALARPAPRRTGADRRGPAARTRRGRTGRRRHAAGRPVHRGGHAPRAGGRPAERRVRDRRAPRLLLRPSLRGPPARHGPGRRRRLPPRGALAGTTAGCRGRFGRARASAPRGPTSTRCWRR